MGGREDFSDGLHECISYDDGDITSRVSTISSHPLDSGMMDKEEGGLTHL